MGKDVCDYKFNIEFLVWGKKAKAVNRDSIFRFCLSIFLWGCSNKAGRAIRVSKDKGGSNSDVILTGGQGKEKPKGLIDAISEVQWFCTAERNGSPVPENFFVLRSKLDYFEVGFKGSFISGLVSALFVPIAIGVIERMIPVFGSSSPSLFDQAFVFLLALSFSIGYALFIGGIGKYYTGNITKTMIRNLIGGVFVGAILKTILAVLLFHFLYIVVLKESNIIYVLSHLSIVLDKSKLIPIYIWLMEFKPILLTSAWFVVVTTIIFLLIPIVMIAITVVKEKRRLNNEIV